jgi:hypothetical protein
MKAQSKPVLGNVADAAEVLGVPEHRVYKMVTYGAFPDGIVVRVGRSILFLMPRLREWAGVSSNGETP